MGANGQKADSASPICQRSFDRFVLADKWLTIYAIPAAPALGPGQTWSYGRFCTSQPMSLDPTPTLPGANIRCRDALDFRKWTKGGCTASVTFRVQNPSEFVTVSAQF